ncbi:MAG: hypothetical protein U0703_11330 [Anaerolineae bacterium]
MDVVGFHSTVKIRFCGADNTATRRFHVWRPIIRVRIRSRQPQAIPPARRRSSARPGANAVHIDPDINADFGQRLGELARKLGVVAAVADENLRHRSGAHEVVSQSLIV